MKNIYLYFFLFFSLATKAQNGFNYQSIFKDANGAVITNTSIVLRLSIIYNSSSGTIIYVETHSLTTPADGVVNLVIGSGTATTGNFSDVDWSKTVIYLKRELDASASGTYIDMGTSLLNGVPKANYSLATQGISYRSNTVSITNLNVTNTITATAFVGDGSGLTNISNSLLDSNNTVAIGGVVSATNSVAVGYQALNSNTTGERNVANGYESLLSNTTGSYNAGFGPTTLRYNTTGTRNIAIGSDASANNTIGGYNVSMGVGALRDNVAGNYSIAIGYQSMMYANNASSAFSPANTAIGFEALMGSSTAANNTGQDNTALGFKSLRNNTTGSRNIAIGSHALNSNTTGMENSTLGQNTLYNNTSGKQNTAIGQEALKGNTSGDENTAVGRMSLIANTTGEGNTALGAYALDANTTGSRNTTLGEQSDVGANNLTNATAIGSEAIVSASNSIQLGDTNVTLVQTSGTISATGANISGTVTATKFSGDGSGLTGISGPTYKSSMVLQDSSSAAADSQIDLPGLSFRWKKNSSGVGKLEVRAESGNAPQALIFYFSYHTNGNDTINFRPDTTSASSSSWNAVDDSWGTTLPSITGYYAVYEFDFSVYPLNTSGNHFGRTYNVKLFLGGWGGVHMRAFYQ